MRLRSWGWPRTVLAVVAAGLVFLVLLPAARQAWRAERSERGHWRAAGERYPEIPSDEVGDGGPATAVRFQDPMGLGEDAAGNLYVADRGRRIWRIEPSGRARVVAGTGTLGRPGFGGSARAEALGSPEGLCVDRDGGVYFADSLNHMVLRVAPNGHLEHVAGTGRRGAAGDGGSAAEAELARPFDVRLDSQGRLYVADHANHRIRRISTDGRIETVAGSGVPGYGGDGGPARRARLNGPYGVFIDAEDTLWIADSGNHVVRRVGADGIIETVAGTGEAGYSGDGGSARSARFDSPQCLFAAAGRGVYVCDEHNHTIRLIDDGGRVSTVAGTGEPGRAREGERASEAPLNDPENVWLRRDGSLLVSDGDNGQVRRIDGSGRIHTFAGVPSAERSSE